MKFSVIYLFSLFNPAFFLRILFAPGSLIPKKYYQPFIKKLEKQIKHPIDFYDGKFTKEQTIILSHSFGGYTAMRDYLYKKTNITGIILINSHFNQRMKMPYLPLLQRKFSIPILTILTTNDKQLPLNAAIDDYCVSYKENLKNKYYYINNGTHFSSFENTYNMYVTVNQIKHFIDEILSNQFNKSININNYITNKHKWFFEDRELNNTKIYNNILPFLKSKPTINNSLYLNHQYLLYKSNNVIIAKELDKYYGLNMHYDFIDLTTKYNQDWIGLNETSIKITNVILKNNTFLLLSYMMEFITKIWINEIIYKTHIPAILYEWFTYEPKITSNKTGLYTEVLTIPIKDNIVYYKFPSKNKFFEFFF